MGFPYFSRGVTVICSTAAYSAGQVIGQGGIQTFTPMPQGGFLQGVQIDLNGVNTSQIDFCMFTSSMPNTTFTDASAITVSSLDFNRMGPIVNVTTWNSMGAQATAGVANGLGYQYPHQNVGNMYFALVARGAVTINSTNGLAVYAIIAS